MMKGRRVGIVDMTMLTSLGDLNQTWNNLIAGKSGISRIEESYLSRFNMNGPVVLCEDGSPQLTRVPYAVDDFKCQIAGQVKNVPIKIDIKDRESLAIIEVPGILGPKDIRRLDRFCHLAIPPLKQLNKDIINLFKPERVGVIAGSGTGGIISKEEGIDVLHTRGPNRVGPFHVSAGIINTLSFVVSDIFKVTGPNLATVTACASSLHATIAAYDKIVLGRIDACIVVGSEASIGPEGIAAFSNAGALSFRNDEPEKASRPFDIDRNGFVMSEGAEALFLVAIEAAERLGIPILTEIVGVGETGDAHNLTEPHPEGLGAAAAMQNAITMADINPKQVGYINTHGTSTDLGDVAEIKAIKRVFEHHAQNLYVSSTKSCTGHLLGAAGALELALCVKVLETNVIPPTINLDNIDPRCEGVRHIPNTAIEAERKIIYTMTNSFGFGGHNASVLVKKYKN